MVTGDEDDGREMSDLTCFSGPSRSDLTTVLRVAIKRITMTRGTTKYTQPTRFERGPWCVLAHDNLAQIPMEALV